MEHVFLPRHRHPPGTEPAVNTVIFSSSFPFFHDLCCADEYSKAADCIQSLLEFSRSEQGRTFPDLTSRCREHKHSLQQVSAWS